MPRCGRGKLEAGNQPRPSGAKATAPMFCPRSSTQPPANLNLVFTNMSGPPGKTVDPWARACRAGAISSAPAVTEPVSGSIFRQLGADRQSKVGAIDKRREKCAFPPSVATRVCSAIACGPPLSQARHEADPRHLPGLRCDGSALQQRDAAVDRR
ncbi:hypothetical protein HUJ05_011169 [Dendroctonus ponderosae]|nr:hypothetical protein HUJ05_011169 [Dendroctonus ponderosae]